ncbi:MAG: CHAT domain-containing protein [Geitlerinemataceae cyanobacterium]
MNWLVGFRQWSFIVLPIAGVLTTSSVFAQIVPANDGTGTIVSPQGNQLDIGGGQLSEDNANLFHSFQEFGLQDGQVANFLSNPNIDNIFGRVTGGNASYINGLIQVTGGNSNLFLLNPAGVVFGENASLNIPADFTVTTATGIGFDSGNWLNAFGENAWADLLGTPNAFDFSGLSSGAAIVNNGNLAVASGQNVGFFGGSVTNSGTITAANGSLIVTAVPQSHLIRISQPGNVLSLEIEPPRDAEGNLLPFDGLDLPGMLAGTPGEVLNSGEITAGNIEVNAQTVENSGSLDVSNPAGNGGTVSIEATESLVQTVTGDMAARGESYGGRVSLTAGTSFLSGTLDVSAVGEGSQGGRIEVLGDAPTLLGASLEASGPGGGGTVLVGGEFQGGGTTPRAQQTVVDALTEIHADALANGDGGNVVLWAEGTTQFAGTITARGGSLGGNGGFIEVSGKEGGSFAGFADASAILGEAGTLLLDPKNITIADGGIGGSSLFAENPQGDFTFDADLVTQTTNTGTNLVLQANNDITVNEAIVTNNLVGNGGNLTFQAGRSIAINADITTDNGSLMLTANETAANGVVDAYRDPPDARINLTPGVTLNAGTGTIDLNLSTGEGLTHNGFGNISLGGNIRAGSLDVTSAGGIVGGDNMVGFGNITTNGDLSLTANTRSIDLGNATLNAGGNIALTGTNAVASGIYIRDSTLATTGTGSITLVGTGGVGFSGSRGVFLDLSSRLTTVDGDINILGTAGSGTQGNHQGVYINGFSTVESTGNGNIFLSGQGGTGTFINQGTTIQDRAIVRSNNGDITITGVGGTGSNIEQQGVLILDDSTVESTGTGNLTIRGTAGSGTGQLYGVSIRDLRTGRIATNTGNVLIEGTGSDGWDDVRIGNGAIGSLTMTGNITIAGDTLGIVNLAALQSRGTLTFQPGDAANNYTFDPAKLAIAQDGFSNIAIGHPQGSGTVTLTGTVAAVTDPLTIQSPLGTLNLGDNLTATDRDLTLNGAISLTEDLTLSTGIGAGNLTLLGTVDGGHNLTLAAGTGNISLNGNLGETTPLNSLELDTTGTVALGSNIATTNDQIYNNPVILTGDSTLTANNVTFNFPVDDGGNLTVNADGAVQFNSDLGSATTIGNLEVTGDTIAFADVDATETVTATAGGNLNAGRIDAADIRLTSTEGSIATGDIYADYETDGTVEATANGNINTAYIEGESITLTSTEGAIETGDIVTYYGTVEATANGNINTGNINTAFYGDNGTGGDIVLGSELGEIRTGNLDSSGATDGGEIFVEADLEITTGAIDSSGNTGAGGNVTLDPIGDVQVTSIDAEGATTGGNITVVAGENFRATGTFIAANGQPASISTIGGTQSGTVNIAHGGGETTPFVVGDASVNGTAGIVTTGTETIENGSFLYNEVGDEISIISGVEAPLTIDPEIEIPVEETPTPEIPVEETPTPETPVEENSAENSGSLQPIPNMPDTTTPDDLVTEVPVASEEPRFTNERLTAPSFDNASMENDRSPTPELSEIGNTVALLNGLENPEGTATDRFNDDTFITNASMGNEGNVISSDDSSSDDSSRVDAIFDSNNNDMVATVWQTEQFRNQEYEEYLGVTADLPNQNVAIAATQERLRDVETQTNSRSALVYIVSRTSQLELIVVPPEGSPIRRSVPEASQEALVPVINEFRRQLTSPRMRDRDTYLASAQQLYQWLIAPLEADLQAAGIDTLLFSLDAGLRSLPIAALHDGSQFLVEKYRLSLIPSFSLLNSDYRRIENVEVLAMGASEFSDQNSLPSVPVELNTISQTLGQGKAFLNEDFTRENLFSQHKTLAYPILHLATHADFQPGTPRNSYIQLWNDKLTLDELPTLNLDDPQVELVVLSACRTAVGDREAELGFGGLAVMSGAKSALASLWYVSDEGTFSLMSGFYENLGMGEIKAEALRRAQMGLISGQIRLESGQLHLEDGTTVSLPPALQSLGDRDLSHPYYWSSFTLIGSPW